MSLRFSLATADRLDLLSRYRLCCADIYVNEEGVALVQRHQEKIGKVCHGAKTLLEKFKKQGPASLPSDSLPVRCEEGGSSEGGGESAPGEVEPAEADVGA